LHSSNKNEGDMEILSDKELLSELKKIDFRLQELYKKCNPRIRHYISEAETEVFIAIEELEDIISAYSQSVGARRRRRILKDE